MATAEQQILANLPTSCELSHDYVLVDGRHPGHATTSGVFTDLVRRQVIEVVGTRMTAAGNRENIYDWIGKDAPARCPKCKAPMRERREGSSLISASGKEYVEMRCPRRHNWQPVVLHGELIK